MDTHPPKHSKSRELTQAAIEAAVNAVPMLGGTISVLLMQGLNSKLNQRRDQWLTELAEAVEDLQGRVDGLDPESLVDNPVFVDAVVTATRIVDRTSQFEKIEVLRNAVINSAMPGAPDLDVQQLYLNLIEELTPTHIRLLTLLHDPPGWFDRRPELTRPLFGMSSSRMTLITAAIPDLGAKGQQIIERFAAGLTVGGLLSGSLSGMMSANGAWQPATSEFAAGFLAFIRDPR